MSAEERLSAGCLPGAGCAAASAQTPPGGRQRQWVGAAQALRAGGLQDQQYRTPHLLQPCGTVTPVPQAPRDMRVVLVLPDPNVSALPALSCLHWVTAATGAPCRPRSGRKAAGLGASFPLGSLSLRCLSEGCFPNSAGAA